MTDESVVRWTHRNTSWIFIACGIAQGLFGLFLLSDATYPVWRAALAIGVAAVLILIGVWAPYDH